MFWVCTLKVPMHIQTGPGHDRRLNDINFFVFRVTAVFSFLIEAFVDGDIYTQTYIIHIIFYACSLFMSVVYSVTKYKVCFYCFCLDLCDNTKLFSCGLISFIVKNILPSGHNVLLSVTKILKASSYICKLHKWKLKFKDYIWFLTLYVLCCVSIFSVYWIVPCVCL